MSGHSIPSTVFWYDSALYSDDGLLGFGQCGCSAAWLIKGQIHGVVDARVRLKLNKGSLQNAMTGISAGLMRRSMLHSAPNVVAGVCGEGECLANNCERGEVGVGNLEMGLPDGEMCEGSDSEPGNVEEVSARSCEMVRVEDDEVLFLEERDERVLSVRLLSLSRCNKVRSAWGLFRSMKLSGLLPSMHACNSLLSCLLRNGMRTDASSLFEFMKRNKIATGHSYSLMLKDVAGRQGLEAAITMFWEMERDSNVNGDFDLAVYNTVISACANVNDWIHAEKIWRNMKEKGLSGNSITYCVLVCTFVRSGQSEMAIDAYNEMVQNGIEPSQDAMQAVIGACSKEGKWDMARSVFQKMLHDKLSPSLITCNILINMSGKAGAFREAYEIYEIVKSVGHVPDSYTWKALLGSLYQAKRYADTLQFFETIRNENSSMLNIHLYNTTLMSCKKLRMWEKALQLLWQMEASGMPVDTKSYNIVLSTCEVARKPKVALQVYEHMLQQDCHPDTFTYLSLIRGCVWGSMWDKVNEILHVVPPNSSLYNAAIQGMFLRGKLHAARKLYTEMLSYDLEPDGKTRAFMLQTYKKIPEQLTF
uniref:PROP1-like PPR domain-containing protein n=1 Tax=Kalanchoe fedtschenkoi TaxID=63787 RepID=A0A7N1A858_KALFE